MQELQVHYNRYDAAPLTGQIDPQLLHFSPGEAWIELPLGDNEEFGIYFDAKDGKVDPELLVTAQSLMGAISKLDNQIQEACAAECRKTGDHLRNNARNYESMLAYVHVFRDHALLGYYGTGVNTEWDETVKLEEGEWVYVG